MAQINPVANGGNDSPFVHLASPYEIETTSYDVITIHEKGDDWAQSWTDPSTGFFWLREAAREALPNCRIIAYQCPKMTPNANTAVSQTLLDAIALNRQEYNRTRVPIIFLAAGKGCALVKHAFLMAQKPYETASPALRELYAYIVGFAFFGGNHRVQPDGMGQHAIQSWWWNDSQYKPDLVNGDFNGLCIDRNITWFCFYADDETADSLIHVDPNQRGFEQAEVSSTNVGIQLTTDELTQFPSAESQKFVKVSAHLRFLLLKAKKLYKSPGKHTGGLRLLSLDGGGVRGLFSVMVLAKIMEEVRQIEWSRGYQNEQAPKPSDVFDLFAGTSTGGLLSIMLSRLEMDTASCKTTYEVLSRDIFQTGYWYGFGWLETPNKMVNAYRQKPWFEGQKLENAMKGLIQQKNPRSLPELAANETLADTKLLYEGDLDSKCFVCAIKDRDHENIRIRSYKTSMMANPPQEDNSHPKDCKIWEAGRATSAAPFYFPAMVINNVQYFDGGMHSNNPILELFDEAKQVYGPKANIQAIVSIGTGSSANTAPSGGVQKVLKYFITRVTDTEAKHRAFLADNPSLHDSYFRFQAPQTQETSNDLGKIDLADLAKMPDIERIANAYASSTEGKEYIKSCAEKLCRV